MAKTKDRFDAVITKTLNVETELAIAGTPITATAAQLNTAGVTNANAVVGVAAGYKVARGQHTTLDADDTVVTGLATVVSVIVTLESDPVAGCAMVTGVIGNQSGAPAAGSIQIKSWKFNAPEDSVIIAASTFTKKVNWLAIGT